MNSTTSSTSGTARPLFKSTIIIWSSLDPAKAGLELQALARAATDGDAYCSKQAAELVEAPHLDPDWDGTDFFADGSGESASASLASRGIEIAARLWTEDGAVDLEFDARRWFATATTKQILALSRRGWSRCVEADAIGEDACSWNPRVADVYRYLELRNKVAEACGRPAIGCDVEVDETDALTWLMHERSDVLTPDVVDPS